MTDFVNGTYKITEGEMITNFNSYECAISSELATLNEISVGSKITFKNPSNSEKTYEFTVTGIYTDNSNTDDTKNMYSPSANKIITGSGVIDLLVADDSTLVTAITPSFIIENKEVIDLFSEEVKQKGLNEYYTINTNLEELESATQSIENVKTFATTFLTIGVSKFKLTMQFVLELLIVSVIMLMIGAGIGSYLSKPVGNLLLQSEIESAKQQEEEISDNFGKGPMNMEFNKNRQVQEISTIDAVVDMTVVIELLGIGILLTLISSLASMISIQRFSPLTILKERS